MHTITTFTNSDLITIDGRDRDITVYAKIGIDHDLAEVMRSDVTKAREEPVKIKVRFEHNAFFNCEEKEILALAEMQAQVAMMSPDLLNAFQMKNGVQSSVLNLRCSQDLSRAFIQDELLNKLQSMSATFHAQSVLLGLYSLMSIASTAEKDDLNWALALVEGDAKPYRSFNVTYAKILKRTIGKALQQEFLMTRAALEDLMSLPHNIESDRLLSRPLQSAKGTINSKGFKKAVPGGRFITDEENEDISTYVNHMTRVALCCKRRFIGGKEVQLVFMIQPHYSRERYEEFNAKGLTHDDCKDIYIKRHKAHKQVQA